MIERDSKDWTWVITRQCPECGFDPSEFDVDDTAATILAIVDDWMGVLADDSATTRSRTDRWSPLEYGCHVRDVFMIFDRRLAAMVEQDGARFENWDQDRAAVEGRYDQQDPRDVAGQLAEAGRELARRFQQVRGELWDHRGFRSNGSEFTVRTFAVYLVHDPLHHLFDVGWSASR